jgi:hypothetical protein
MKEILIVTVAILIFACCVKPKEGYADLHASFVEYLTKQGKQLKLAP